MSKDDLKNELSVSIISEREKATGNKYTHDVVPETTLRRYVNEVITEIDFNMFGHQVVAHLNPALGPSGKVTNHCNPVDDHAVPVPHFGVVLEVDVWKQLAERVRTFVDDFIIEPYVRFEGLPGEQHTMFFEDPSGNALEFKAFANIDAELFATTREPQV